MNPLEPPQEVVTAVLSGKKMPTEKLFAWMLRIILVLGMLYVVAMYTQLAHKADAAVKAQAEHDAWAATQAKVHTADFAAVERRVTALEVTNPDVLRRLAGIEAELSELNKYLRERGGR